MGFSRRTMTGNQTYTYILVQVNHPVTGRSAVGAIVQCQEQTVERASLALIRYLRASQRRFSLNYDRRRMRYLFGLDGCNYELLSYSPRFDPFVLHPEWWGIPVWEVPRLPEEVK